MTPQPRSNDDGLCGALFDTPSGTGVCEAFGEHKRHSGVMTVGRFLCRRCRRQVPCNCPLPVGGSTEGDQS